MNAILCTITILCALGGTLQTKALTLSRVSPATLAQLAKSDGNDQYAGRIILAASDAKATAPLKAEEAAKVGTLLERSVQGRASVVRSFLVDGRAVTQSRLEDGATVLTNGLAHFMLLPVKIQTDVDEETMKQIVSKIVLKRLRIPPSARNPITGSFGQQSLSNGDAFWRGTLFFGYVPNVNGVYHIAESKWHDHVYAWTDGQVLWIEFGRDDLTSGNANGNPSGPVRKGGG